MKQPAGSLSINCHKHGEGIAAAVCGHLVNNMGAPLGFVENSAEPTDLQGWCYACEFVFSEEQDKTVRFVAFCNHAMVCEQCYADIKSHHTEKR